MTIPDYADPTLPAEARVMDLLGRMELDEKLAQLGAVEFARMTSGGDFDEEAALATAPHGIGQVTRIGATTSLRPEEGARLYNKLQRTMISRTRLGIPVVVHEESLAGYCARDATVFPQALALACSWDPGLVAEVADCVRGQLMAVGARQSLAPVLDVARDPRWGRLEETYGEDPVLAASLGTAYVKAMQTDDLSRGVLATGKHFLAHGLSEGGRNHGPVQVGPRELREVFAEPFAAAIRDAGLASVMSSYSCVDGLPGSGSAQILTGLLREELGFDGFVVADYFSVSLLMSYHRVAGDRAEAAVKALAAGLDVELPALDCFGAPLKAAIEAGSVPQGLVDTAVRRVLAAKIRLGLFEGPYVDPAKTAGVFAAPAAVQLARRAAAQGIVLLKNEGALPLAGHVSEVAVIGPAADDRRLLQGDYHYPAHQEVLFEEAPAAPSGGSPDGAADLVHLATAKGNLQPGEHYTEHVTPLAGLRAALKGRAEVTYEKGCELVGDSEAAFGAAVAAASKADIAIVVVGGRSGLHPTATVGEARDAVDLRLTGRQSELIAAVAGTGTPTVAVVMSGRAHALGEIAQQVQALLVAWPLGQQGGNALADVLVGKCEPGGRLPVTLPRATGQVPIYHSHRSGGGRSMFYGAYTDCAEGPLFSFGHGLGYTTFGYSDLSVEATDTLSPVHVSARVTNTGERPGEEVVQLYASDLVASVARPERSLVAFLRVALAPSESARVSFEIHPSRLAFYDEGLHFVVEPGLFRFGVGASASDIRLEAEVALTGQVTRYEQRSVVAVTAHVEKETRMAGQRLQ